MSNVSIGWDATAPADGDGAGAGAGAIRSLKTAIQTGLAAEHVWPASTGNAGAHALGSARVFVGSSSQISSADTTGRLMWDQTRESLVYLSSTSTVYVGGRAGMVGSSNLTTALGQRIVTSFVSVSGTSWPSGAVSWPQSYAVAPYVVASVFTTAEPPTVDIKKAMIPIVGAVDTSQCKVGLYNQDGLSTTSYAIVHIMAVGPVAF